MRTPPTWKLFNDVFTSECVACDNSRQAKVYQQQVAKTVADNGHFFTGERLMLPDFPFYFYIADYIIFVSCGRLTFSAIKENRHPLAWNIAIHQM